MENLRILTEQPGIKQTGIFLLQDPVIWKMSTITIKIRQKCQPDLRDSNDHVDMRSLLKILIVNRISNCDTFQNS